MLPQRSGCSEGELSERETDEYFITWLEMSPVRTQHRLLINPPAGVSAGVAHFYTLCKVIQIKQSIKASRSVSPPWILQHVHATVHAHAKSMRMLKAHLLTFKHCCKKGNLGVRCCKIWYWSDTKCQGQCRQYQHFWIKVNPSSDC